MSQQPVASSCCACPTSSRPAPLRHPTPKGQRGGGVERRRGHELESAARGGQGRFFRHHPLPRPARRGGRRGRVGVWVCGWAEGGLQRAGERRQLERRRRGVHALPVPIRHPLFHSAPPHPHPPARPHGPLPPAAGVSQGGAGAGAALQGAGGDGEAGCVPGGCWGPQRHACPTTIIGADLGGTGAALALTRLGSLPPALHPAPAPSH